jgi:L-amino acid N-acyltransferase YncA
MKPAFAPRSDFRRRFRFKDRTVVVRSLVRQDREALLAFARSLPEDDLLFLDRGIAQPDEVDAWIEEAAQGRLVTLLACDGDAVIGYATFDRGSVRWTRHVSELRVVVADSARGLGLGRLLLELAFEMVQDAGMTKIVARMTPDQAPAQRLFEALGFRQEAVLRDHALGADGQTHDLIVLTFHTRQHREQCCNSCGTPVLSALGLEGLLLCSSCYESQYSELGGGS